MMCEEGHPDTALRDWRSFGREFSPFLFDEVIERYECRIPKQFVPLARGAAIASDTLLRSAGYRPGMGRPADWYEASPQCFERHLCCDSHLMVRECECTSLWTVERLGGGRCRSDVDEVLVHVFGSTPVFTLSHQSAMWLAEHCHSNGPPHGLRWIKAIPKDLDFALEAVRQRQVVEGIFEVGAPLPALH